MQVRNLLFTLAVLGVVAGGHAASTAADISSGINDLASLTSDLSTRASEFSIQDAVSFISGFGNMVHVSRGFDNIIVSTTDITRKIPSLTSKDTTEASSIADAFERFSHEHQRLLKILTDKAVFLQALPIVNLEYVTKLRLVAAVVETLAVELIDIMESIERAQSKVKTERAALAEATATAIKAIKKDFSTVTRKMLREQAVITAA